MPPSLMRRRTAMAAALLAATLGFGLGGGGRPQAAGSDLRPLDGAPQAAVSLATATGGPLQAIVPAEPGRLLVGRLANDFERSRAGLLVALLLGVLPWRATAALGRSGAAARSRRLAPHRRSAPLRAPPGLALA